MLPHLRVLENRMHDREMQEQEQDAQKPQARTDKMENGQKFQVVRINLALVPG